METNNENAVELISIARKIKQWQDARGKTTSWMLRKYAGLGSDRTYNKLISGNTEQLNVETQLVNYRGALLVIESIGDISEKSATIISDLSSIVQVECAVLKVMERTGINRFVLIEGDTGSGKTTTMQYILGKYGDRFRWTEMSVLFGDSPYNFLCLVLKAYGHETMPTNAAKAFHLACEEMKVRRGIFVDELHHAGPRILNTIKTLINHTPCEFICGAKETLWRELEKASMEDCRQLTQNRLSARVRLDRLNGVDVARILKRACPGIDFPIEHAVSMIDKAAKGHGNLSFVRGVCERAAEKYETGKIGMKDLAALIAEEQQSR
jgi:hypothetical protein